MAVKRLQTSELSADTDGMGAKPCRMLFVALSTFCWSLTALFVLFGVVENLYRTWLYFRHSLQVTERAPHGQVMASTALILCLSSPTFAFAAWRWWQNRWRPALAASTIGYLVTAIALWLREP